MKSDPYPWTPLTRLLHGLLALSVMIQVLLILIRENIDRHGEWSTYRPSLIMWHKWNGFIVLGLVIGYFIVKAFQHKKQMWIQFYPLTQEARSKIAEDFTTLRQGKLPVRSTPTSLGGLAGFIQGLGLLLVFGLALIGALAMAAWAGLLIPSNWGSFFIQAHKLLGGLIWWYLGGHIGMAIIHRLLPARFQSKK
jgi:cytochrome b561